MSRILMLHSTVDGHTVRICERLKTMAERDGHAVTLAALDSSRDTDLAPFDAVVIGASIRYGKHRPEVAGFMRARRGALEARRCAFFTVNIVARKAAKNTPDTNPYMKKFLRQIGWRPPLLGVFAGKLDYPRYGFWDRQIIRFIMLLTRGPTDPTAVVEFTDWNQVEAFGHRIRDALAGFIPGESS
jgi:menaquinone-dependent protoporphyrinogen oxidase